MLLKRDVFEENEPRKKGRDLSLPFFTIEYKYIKLNNLEMDGITKRLTAKNLSAKEGETLKEMAARHKTAPIELMKMILVEQPRRK